MASHFEDPRKVYARFRRPNERSTGRYRYEERTPSDECYPISTSSLPSPRRQTRDTEKDKYEAARRRNLHVWSRWRTEMNESLICDRGTLIPLQEALAENSVFDYESRHNEDKLRNPTTLMNYSLSTNDATALNRDDFLQFGIPRAQVDSDSSQYGRLFETDDVTSRRRSKTVERPTPRERPRDDDGYFVIKKLPGKGPPPALLRMHDESYR